MDKLDVKILDFIQRSFPLEKRPFLRVAFEFDISEEEAFLRIQTLKRDGVIRRIGAVIDPVALGAKRALIACRVEPSKVNEIASIVNSYDEVTHNYLRDGDEFNLWFTVVARDEDNFDRIIGEIRDIVGEQNILILDAVKTFKIQAVFDSEIIENVD